jgi:DNA polymerase-3 subunit delta'
MNDQAANKLLKLLEEPPPMTLFLMVTENPDQLLGTIRSRCMPVKIPRIEDASLLECLTKEHRLEPDKARDITRLSEGNYLRALDIIAEEGNSKYNFVKFRDLMRSCFKGSIPELIKHAEELAGFTREKQKSFLEYSLGAVRESMALHYNQEEIIFISGEEKGFTTNFAPFVNGKNVIRFTEELTRTIHDIERNGNGRIVLLDMVLKLAALIKS